MNAFDWMEPLPRGRHLGLCQNDREIGFAIARQYQGESEVGLLTSDEFWSGPQTAILVATLASYLDSPIRYLRVALGHADTLEIAAPFEFERRRERERQYVFWSYPFAFSGTRMKSSGVK
jgi:hypothetical protein